MYYNINLTDEEYMCVMKAAKILQDKYRRPISPSPVTPPTDVPDFPPTINPLKPHYLPPIPYSQVPNAFANIGEVKKPLTIMCKVDSMPCKHGRLTECQYKSKLTSYGTAISVSGNPDISCENAYIESNQFPKII